jgi:CheY-like chemotaxis protein
MSENKNRLSLVRNDEPSSKWIMVIDETQDILDLFDLILTDAGYRVSLHYYNGRDLQEVKQVAPDLIISDLSLKEQDAGWRFLQKLKMEPQTRNIPVLVCTSVPEITQDPNGRLAELGVAVLLKPFIVDDLLSIVAKLLSKVSF